MIQKVLIFTIGLFIAYGCASTKKVKDVSIGTWDYTIKNTPEGDLAGNFVIAKEAESYIGSLNSTQGSIALEDITVEDGNLKCNFDYMGYSIMMTGLFEGEAFTGKVSVDYNDFPMTAVKRP